ncbi:hypothetical protein ES703_20659 [subsurface metagenome]
MTEKEYRNRVWEILKGYSDELDIENLEALLEEIMAVPFPEKTDFEKLNAQQKLDTTIQKIVEDQM